MKLTIFTPTYNRAELLGKLYVSLKEQDNKDFVWLIVDDGSKDTTKKKVEFFKSEKIVNIQYIYQENQGKHVATNTAIDACKTEYMMCVDSDDTLTHQAVVVINESISKVTENTWAIVGPREVSTNGEWKIPNYTITKYISIYDKYNFLGDTYTIMKMKYLKKFKFPVFLNEKLLPEMYLYDYMDGKYEILTINPKIYVGEYCEDGYTKNKLRTFTQNKTGVCLAFKYRAYAKYATLKTKMWSYVKYLSLKRILKVNTNISAFENIPIKNHVKIIGGLLSILGDVYYRIEFRRKWLK